MYACVTIHLFTTCVSNRFGGWESVWIVASFSFPRLVSFPSAGVCMDMYGSVGGWIDGGGCDLDCDGGGDGGDGRSCTPWWCAASSPAALLTGWEQREASPSKPRWKVGSKFETRATARRCYDILLLLLSHGLSPSFDIHEVRSTYNTMYVPLAEFFFVGKQGAPKGLSLPQQAVFPVFLAKYAAAGVTGTLLRRFCVVQERNYCCSLDIGNVESLNPPLNTRPT